MSNEQISPVSTTSSGNWPPRSNASAHLGNGSEASVTARTAGSLQECCLRVNLYYQHIIQGKEEELSSLKTKHHKEIQSYIHKLFDLDVDIQVRDEQIEQLKTQISKHGDLVSLDLEIQVLKENQAKLLKKLSDFINIISTTNSQWTQKENEWKNKFQDQDQKIRELSQQLKEARDTCITYEHKITIMNKELEELKGEKAESSPTNPGNVQAASLDKNTKGALHVDSNWPKQYGKSQRPVEELSVNECLKSAMKLKRCVTTILTASGLRQQDNKGLKLLNEFITEIELACPLDPIRVAMLPHTVESFLLRRLGLESPNILELRWEDVKQKLMAYLPRMEPEEAERRLLKMAMTAEDDVEEFTTRVMKSYQEMCQILGVGELDISLNEVLSITVTNNMQPELLRSYGDAIKRQPDRALQRLEKALREKNFRMTAFRMPRTRATSSYNHMQNVSHSYNGMQENTACAGSLVAARKPFQGATGGSGIPSGQKQPRQRQHSTSSYANGVRQKRIEIFKSWNDWRCKVCGEVNRATWYTCDHGNCNGKATERQRPSNSWDCIPDCGQTNWEGDHFCSACLKANPDISTNRLRQLPASWKPRPRSEQQWYSKTPVTEA